MFVSIIIPTYNRSKLIIRTIESVLAQTFSDFEIIVVDDGSTDNTRGILKEHIDSGKIKYIYQNNAGPARARNNGIRNARGEILAFLDSDDEWTQDKLEKLMGLFKEKGQDILVYSDIEYVDVNGDKKGNLFSKTKPHEGKVAKKMLADNFVATSSVAVAKSLIEKAGGFPEFKLPIGEDYYLWLKIAGFADFYFVNEPLVKYRVHSGQITTNKKDVLMSFLILYWKILLNKKEFEGIDYFDIVKTAFLKMIGK